MCTKKKITYLLEPKQCKTCCLCVFVVITQTNSLYPFKTPVRPKYDKNC